MMEISTKFTISPDESIGIVIAFLNLSFKTITLTREFKLSKSHEKFIKQNPAEFQTTSAGCSLYVNVQQGKPYPHKEWSTSICKNKIWEIWKNDTSEYFFFNPNQQPVRQIQINAAFSAGTMLGEFICQDKQQEELIPQSLEIVLFSNWLAGIGDFILHASGFVKDGKAYAFLGESGAGKSTLIRSLLTQPGVTILGEDQVILRCLDDQFWAFGTPWHLDPMVCSPMGAPLNGLFFLDRKKHTGLHRLTLLTAFERILQTAFIPYYREDALEKIMDTISKLINAVPLKTLSYNLEDNLLNIIESDLI